jgi:hypothetical protein
MNKWQIKDISHVNYGMPLPQVNPGMGIHPQMGEESGGQVRHDRGAAGSRQ